MNSTNHHNQNHKEGAEEVKQPIAAPQSGWRDFKMMLPLSIVVAAALVSGTWLYIDSKRTAVPPSKQAAKKVLTESVIPEKVELPVTWGDLGQKLIAAGAIDKDKFIALYDQRGGLSQNDLKMLTEGGNGRIVMTEENSGFVLNMLWAFGLANKNEILEKGPMTDKRYGGAGKFASTGGWTLAKGDAMQHYSKHALVKLTSEQQALVAKMAASIYRPCCDNSTIFPDCNHGMAMLGLLELMASQGASESDMYKAALGANMLWFPGTYETVAEFLAQKGVSWKSTDAKGLLDRNYSSASAFKAIQAEVAPSERGGSSCGA